MSKKQYLIAADTHERTTFLIETIEKLGNIDGLIHLGDHTADAEEVSFVYPKLPIFCVRGNNDWGREPSEQMLNLQGNRVFLTHGHRYRVKRGLDLLIDAAREKEADIVLFGHTHQGHLERQGNLWIVNPGAMYHRQYAVMTLEEETVQINLF